MKTDPLLSEKFFKLGGSCLSLGSAGIQGPGAGVPGLKASLIIVIYSLGFTLKNFLKKSPCLAPTFNVLVSQPGTELGAVRGLRVVL